MIATMQKLAAWLRWLVKPERFVFTTVECIALRLLFAWLAWDYILTEPGRYPGTPYPRGLAHFMDLSFIHDAGTVTWLIWTAKLGLVLGALGIAEPLTLGWTLFVICASKSYNQSQGYLGHAGQLLTLCLLAQWLGSLWAMRGKFAGARGLIFAGMKAWPLQLWWMINTIAAGYTVSAITKLVNSGGLWPFKGGVFILQMLKAHQERISSSGQPPGGIGLWAVDLLHGQPWLGSGLLLPAFLLEFSAFLALLNRRMSLLIGLGLLSFHQMTELLMSIGFGTHQQLLWLLLVNPVYWLIAAWCLRFRRTSELPVAH
jgi:hypothetical protein